MSAALVTELDALLRGTGITSLTLTTQTETITLRREAGTGAPRATAADPAGTVVTAPCSGVFLHRHPLRDAPLVEPGQNVAAGTVLGLLQVGPLVLHVAAPRAGIVAALIAADGAVVGYGTPLVQLAEVEPP